MSFLMSLFGEKKSKTSSAKAAQDRLSVIVASNNLRARINPASIEKMQREILEVVKSYVDGVKPEDINIQHRKHEESDVLQMNINLSDSE